MTRQLTLLTKGMPHPTNYDCALSVENLIREQSAIPATIALLSGRIHIGLTKAQLAHLAEPAVNAKSIKLSRRDLARGIYAKVDAGTTVAGTMMLANNVGIDLFVTGGESQRWMHSVSVNVLTGLPDKELAGCIEEGTAAWTSVRIYMSLGGPRWAWFAPARSLFWIWASPWKCW